MTELLICTCTGGAGAWYLHSETCPYYYDSRSLNMLKRTPKKNRKGWQEMTQTNKADKLAAARAKAQEPKQTESVNGEDVLEKQAYVNTVSFSGRVTRDTEFTTTKNNKELLKNTIAIWQPNDQPSMFFDLALWIGDDNQELAESFLALEKGERVVITGRLNMREFQKQHFYTITVFECTSNDMKG